MAMLTRASERQLDIIRETLGFDDSMGGTEQALNRAIDLAYQIYILPSDAFERVIEHIVEEQEAMDNE